MESYNISKTSEVLTILLFVDDVPVGTSEISIFENMNYYSRLYINPKYRGKGYGKKLWNKTQEVLDENDMDLTIEINPYGPLSYDDLYKFYSSDRTKDVFGTLYRVKSSVFNKVSA